MNEEEKKYLNDSLGVNDVTEKEIQLNLWQILTMFDFIFRRLIYYL